MYKDFKIFILIVLVIFMCSYINTTSSSLPESPVEMVPDPEPVNEFEEADTDFKISI